MSSLPTEISATIASRKSGWIIAILGFILYLPTIQYGYAWDDAIVITENTRVQKGWSGITELWTPHFTDRLQDKYGFRPFVMTTFAIEYGLWGPKPGISHLLNALLYGLLCMLVFQLLRQVFPRLPAWVPIGVALLFLVHPLHVEAVANIKSRDEILAMLWGILSVKAFLNWYLSRKIKWLALSFLSFGLAILSKESAFYFPVFMVAAVWVMENSTLRAKLLASAVACLWGILALIWILKVALPQQIEVTDGLGLFHESPTLGNPLLAFLEEGQGLYTYFAIPLRYLGLFFWPWPLRYYYGLEVYPLSDYGDPLGCASQALLLLWAMIAIVRYKRDRIPAFAGVGFVSTMLLYAQAFTPLPDFMAERFMLVPSLFLCLMVGWLLWQGSLWLESRWPFGRPLKIKQLILPTPIIGLLMCTVIIIWGVRTLHRQPVWQSNLSLFQTDMPALDHSVRAHYFLAGALVQQAQSLGAPIPPAAETHYRQAIELSPLAYNARIELAQVLYQQNRFAEGIQIMRDCREAFPQASRPHYFLGYGLYFSQQYPEAITELKKAFEMAPLRDDAPLLLAWAYFFNQQPQEAIQLAQQCRQTFPNNWQFTDALSDFYFGTDLPDQGFQILKEGIEKYQVPALQEKWQLRKQETANLSADKTGKM